MPTNCRANISAFSSTLDATFFFAISCSYESADIPTVVKAYVAAVDTTVHVSHDSADESTLMSAI